MNALLEIRCTYSDNIYLHIPQPPPD